MATTTGGLAEIAMDHTVMVHVGDAGSWLTRLTDGLDRAASENGTGKSLASGYLYMGGTSVERWRRASGDLYDASRRSETSTLRARLTPLRSSLPSGKYHLVSLGPGNGEKDLVLIRELDVESGRWYLPVDMSVEMLSLALDRVQLGSCMPKNRTLAVQLDFTQADDVKDLREIVYKTVGDEPVVFALLGNTLANFTQDEDLLGTLGDLLRSQDRLLVEIATSDQLSDAAAEQAAREYSSTRSFREFLLTALQQHTDLRIEPTALHFQGRIEDDRALLVTAFYRNDRPTTIDIALPDGSVVQFPPGDTIRLAITRKYLNSQRVSPFAKSGLRIDGRQHTTIQRPHGSARFGVELLLLAGQGATPVRDRARVPDVWE